MEYPGNIGGRKTKAAVLFVVWSMFLVQGTVVRPALGQETPPPDEEVRSNKAHVIIHSDPSGQTITVDGQRTGEKTPNELVLNPGQHTLMVNAEGYQPLSHGLTLSAGDRVELDFILIRTPPEPPTPEELRALAPPLGSGDPNADYWAEAKPRHLANDACKDCHGGLLDLHASGNHRTLACDDCHGDLTRHVIDGALTVEIQIFREEAIQGLCMTCHDRNNRNRVREPARTVDLAGHMRELKVRPVNRCEDCHHVHSPQKWVHEARDMVGLPEMMASIPMLDERMAVEKRDPYNAMAETFLVFPFAPGVLGLAVTGTDGEFPSETLIVSGLALSLGAYMLGKVVYSRELGNIRALNDERRAANIQVKEHNLLIKKAMVDHERDVKAWIEAAENRGRVVTRVN